MATTQTVIGDVAWAEGETLFAVDLTTIEPGVGVNVSYATAGAAGAECFRVTHEVTVTPTTRDSIEIRRLRASDSPSSSTVNIMPDTAAGGDLAGATVRLYLHFRAAASGGISA